MTLVKEVGGNDEDLERRLISGWVEYLEPSASQIINKQSRLQASFVVEALQSSRPQGRAGYPEYVALLEAMHISSKCQLKNPTFIESSIIVISPHLGFSKLMVVPFADVLNSHKIDTSGLPHREPWIWRHLPAWSIARLSNAAFVPIEMLYGAPFDDIQQAYGAISLDLRRRGLVEDMLERMGREQNRGLPIVFSMFPEAGSSGKRDGAGRPFRLESFRQGFALSAQRFGIPVVPIAHIVDPVGRSHLHALEPLQVQPTRSALHYCELAREALQDEMRRMLAFVVDEPGAYL